MDRLDPSTAAPLRRRAMTPPNRPRFCAHCRAGLAPDAKPEDPYCGKPTCQTVGKSRAAGRLGRERKARLARWKAETEARVRAPLAAAAGRIGAADLDAIAHVAVPFQNWPLGPRTEAEREAFIGNLRRAIDAAFADAAPDAPSDAPCDPGIRTGGDCLDFDRRDREAAPDRLALNAACMACQGNCCLQGYASHGFITEDTIAFYRHQFPEATAERTLADYLSHLPEISTRVSCLYHGARGCCLPRNLRANICNNWNCQARIDLKSELAAKGDARVAVVAVPGDHLERPGAGGARIRVVTVTDGDDARFHDDLTLPAMPVAED